MVMLIDRDIDKARALVIDSNPTSRSVMTAQLRDLGVGTIKQTARVNDAPDQLFAYRFVRLSGNRWVGAIDRLEVLPSRICDRRRPIHAVALGSDEPAPSESRRADSMRRTRVHVLGAAFANPSQEVHLRVGQRLSLCHPRSLPDMRAAVEGSPDLSGLDLKIARGHRSLPAVRRRAI